MQKGILFHIHVQQNVVVYNDQQTLLGMDQGRDEGKKIYVVGGVEVGVWVVAENDVLVKVVVVEDFLTLRHGVLLLAHHFQGIFVGTSWLAGHGDFLICIENKL